MPVADAAKVKKKARRLRSQPSVQHAFQLLETTEDKSGFWRRLNIDSLLRCAVLRLQNRLAKVLGVQSVDRDSLIVPQDVIDDMRFIENGRRIGIFETSRGEYVAVFQKHIVDYDDCPATLRDRVSQNYPSIPRGAFVIDLVGASDE